LKKNNPMILNSRERTLRRIPPLCPVFHECGGCQFQDIAYADELILKGAGLAEVFAGAGLTDIVIAPVTASANEYHYRCRLDLKFLKIRSGEMFMGFSPVKGYQVVEVDSCPIAMEAISAFLPELKRQACDKIPSKYRNANLTIKTGDDGRVFWGGIGRRSLRMAPHDFLWTELEGKRIHYSLETFFQANLSILPLVMQAIRDSGILDSRTTFFDLYGGVGLFGVTFAREVRDVILMEENGHAVTCAHHTVQYNRLTNVHLIEGRVEEFFAPCLTRAASGRRVAMIDPPRAGLSAPVRDMLARTGDLDALIYLSCNPQTLVRDLQDLIGSGWRIRQVIPFDFFPRTRHLETLVVMERARPLFFK